MLLQSSCLKVSLLSRLKLRTLLIALLGGASNSLGCWWVRLAIAEGASNFQACMLCRRQFGSCTQQVGDLTPTNAVELTGNGGTRETDVKSLLPQSHALTPISTRSLQNIFHRSIVSNMFFSSKSRNKRVIGLLRWWQTRSLERAMKRDLYRLLTWSAAFHHSPNLNTCNCIYGDSLEISGNFRNDLDSVQGQ